MFLEPVRQQPIYRRGDRVPDDAHRLAGELCGRTNAAAQSAAVDQRRTPHLRAAVVVSGDSVPQGREKLWAVGQPLGGHRSTSDVRHAVRGSDPAAIRKVDTDRARRGGADRRRVPGSAVPAHLSAIDGAGTGGSRHHALLLAWSEHLYQYMLLSSARNWTVAVALEQFWDSDEAPWNYMMALAIVYALPPLAVFYALRLHLVAALTLDRVRR